MAQNPYYIQPASPLRGVGALFEGIGSRVEHEQAVAEESRKQQIREEVAKAEQTENYDKIADLSIKNPWLSEELKQSIGFVNELTEQNALESARRILSGQEDPADVLIERGEMVLEQGGDATGTIAMAEQARENPEGARKVARSMLAMLDHAASKELRELEKADEGMPVSEYAGIAEFEYLTEGLSPEDLARAKRIKLGLSPRATESAVAKGEKAFASESGKLQARYNLEPQVAGAVQAAKNTAIAEAKYSEETRSNEKAWNVYNGGMSNLAQAMAGTETGPFIGFIPAITANQQIADGAVAVMAPVLKQMFRAAGEGIFTDKDQELLLKMVPDRRDLPEARIAKIKAVDSIVRAKLGKPLEEETREEKTATEMTDEELMMTIRGR